MTMKKTLPQKWLCLGKLQLSKSMFQPIKNIPCFLKPSGGLWVSPYTPQRKFKSAWQEWCTEENFGIYEKGVILTLAKNIKIFTIDSQQDLINLIDEIGLSEESAWFSYWKVPNFEKAAEKYDMLYLTEKGQVETRLPWKNREYTLYGWDCRSGILLNWRIKNQKPMRLPLSPEELQQVQT